MFFDKKLDYRTTVPGGLSSIADILPFKVCNSECDTVYTIDGGMMAVIEYSPYDIEMVSAAEHEALISRIYDEIKLLFAKSSSWSLYSYAYRKNAMKYITSDRDSFSSTKAPYWVDHERMHKFNNENTVFTTKFYLVIKFSSEAIASLSHGILGWLTGSKKEDEQRANELEKLNFNNNINNMVSGMKRVIPNGVKRLVGSELLSFLRYSFNPVDLFDLAYDNSGKPILFLDTWLADCSFIADSEYPKIRYQGKTYHLGIVSVRNYPQYISPSFCGLINNFNFPCRFSTRFVAKNKAWSKQFMSWRRTILSGAAVKRNQSTADKLTGNSEDSSKVALLHDSNEAVRDLEAGEIFGNLNIQFMVWDEDINSLNDKLLHIEEVTRSYGYVCQRESFNASVSYIGALPGEDDMNLRYDLCSLSNAVFSYPVTTNWAGAERNMVVEGGGPPLFYALSSGNTPLMISTHNAEAESSGTDIPGHTMIIGQTGGGKSVLLVFMALQFAKYGGRVIYFDKKRSCMAATLGSEGQFFDFGDYQNPDNIGIQPLRDLEDEDDLAAAYLWIKSLLNDKGDFTPNQDEQQDISNVLKVMAVAMKPEHRTIAVFKSLVQYPSIKKALEDYVSGPYAGLFDKKNQVNIDSWWSTFEIGEVLNDPYVSRPLLRYLFYYIEKTLDERPTMIVIDEAFDFLSDDFFAKNFNTMLRQFRKLNAFVVMATQSLDDLLKDGDVSTSIINNVVNKIFIPSPEINRPNIRELYKSIGLSDTHLNTLKKGKQKRDYMFQIGDNIKLSSLGLDAISLAFCAASNKSDLAELFANIARNDKKFNPYEWLNYKKINAADIEYLRKLSEGEEVDIISA